MYFWQSKSIVNYALLPFSYIYHFCGILRKIFASSIKLPAKTICIGNITVGGAGKTQVAIWLGSKLQQAGFKCVVISKGYKGKLKTPKIVEKEDAARVVGDEAKEISQFIQTISSNKIKNTYKLLNAIKPDVIIVDDGMQSPYFHKDYTILVVDQDRLFGNNLLFPAGPLRESINKGAQKADCVVFVGNKDISQNQAIPVLDKHTRNRSVYNARIEPNMQINTNIRYYAFCGIGNADRFFKTLKIAGLLVVETKKFMDHCQYKDSDIKSMLIEAKAINAELITTRKDIVKISAAFPIKCFEVKLVIKNEDDLLKDIYEKISIIKH